MPLCVSPFKGNGEIFAPPSKSCAHRWIMLCSAYGEESRVCNVGASSDVKATIECVKSLGKNARAEGNDVVFSGALGMVKGEVALDVGESGSTYRFLLPLCGALGIKARFLGRERVFDRPISPLLKVLNEHGCASDGKRIEGKLRSGVYEIDGSASSQFISGLVMALPLLGEESKIIIKGEKVSSGYIDLTISLLKNFGVEVEKVGDEIFVGKSKGLKPPAKITCEGDWSGAAVFLGFGALGEKVAVKGLDLSSLQPDKKIVEILKSVGLDPRVNGDKVEVKSGKISSFDIDCAPFPDLAPLLSVLAAKAEGESVIRGVQRLKGKESDRLSGICETLKKAQIKYDCDGESIRIRGGKPSAASFCGYGDHRMIMSQALLASFCDGDSQIESYEGVGKSYPSFFEDLRKIGGKINVRI